MEVYDLRQDKSEDPRERPEVLAAQEMYEPRPRIDVWAVFGSDADARQAGHTGV